MFLFCILLMNNRNIFPAQDLILTGERVSYVSRKLPTVTTVSDSIFQYIGYPTVLRRPTIDKVTVLTISAVSDSTNSKSRNTG